MLARRAALVLLFASAAACGGGTPPASTPAPTAAPSADRWPTKGWATSTPDAEGMDTATLAALDQEFAAGKHGQVTGMLVIRHGAVVFEKSYPHDFGKLFEGRDPVRGPYNYYDPDWHPYYKGGALHTMQSVSKSVTSTLVGIAIGRKELPEPSAKVLPLFSSFTAPASDPRRDAMTLEDVLTMRTGIRWDESTVAYTDPANTCAAMERSQDWVQFVLDQPMAADPGTTFVYNSGATELLSYLIKQGTGKHAHEYAAEHLFAPLGITDTYWKTTPTGLADTEGGLYLTPRDLAKIGYLYLKGGRWDGAQILPESWVARATTPIVDLKSGPNGRGRKYGYQWWVLPTMAGEPIAYAAIGYGGQRLIVVPSKDLVAVFTGWNVYEQPEFAPFDALDRVLAAVR